MRRKSMRRAAFLSLFVLFSLALAACGGGAVEEAVAVSNEPILDLGGREVTIMVENAYPPFNFIDDAGEGAGWDYDVWREICERRNCEPVFVEAAWPPFEMMAAGEIDVAADGITIKMGRSMVVDYSDPYIEYGMVMLMRKDNFYETGEDFAADSEARIASQAGTTNESAALALVGEGRVDNYGEWPIAVEALLSGDADGVAIDEVAAVAYIQEHPDELEAGFNLTSGEFLAFVFPPGSNLVAPINYTIQEMLEDGSMDEICQKWLLRDCSTEATMQ
jgi:polar amino acid transport system substrate-binding protein